MSTRTAAVVEYPPPTLHGPACTDCAGAGVTGDRYEMPGGERPLLVDVFCPTCLGCGHARHDDCWADAHADVDRGDLDDLLADPHTGETSCPSCLGRSWNAVQGWNAEDASTSELVILRVPCGCTADRVRRIATD